jgi:hypothetical protein
MFRLQERSEPVAQSMLPARVAKSSAHTGCPSPIAGGASRGPFGTPDFRRVRAFLLAAVALSLVGLSLLTFWHISSALPEKVRKSFEGQRLRGVRHVQVVHGRQVARLEVEEVQVRRSRLGVLRIGFARELFLRDAVIELSPDATDGVEPIDSDSLRKAFRNLTRGAGSRATLSGLEVQGLRFALTRSPVDRLEFRAETCRSGLLDRGRIRCEGDIRLSDGGEELSFAALEFDPSTKSFVSARLASGAHRSVQTALDRANRMVGEEKIFSGLS